jgi:tRNA U54 and U55 pseudouridine synthase Pus10
MKNILSLNQEIDALIKRKISDCNCNPCTCTEEKKEKYFQELKDILSRLNFESLRLNLTFDLLFKESHY